MNVQNRNVCAWLRTGVGFVTTTLRNEAIANRPQVAFGQPAPPEMSKLQRGIRERTRLVGAHSGL